MEPTRCLFFDAGGTLLHPHPSVGAVYAEVAARHGFACDADRLDQGFRVVFRAEHQGARADGRPAYGPSRATAHAFWKRLVARVFAEAGEEAARIARDEATFARYFDDLFDDFARPERFALAEGALETIGAFRRAGWRTGLLSNWDVRLRPLIERGPLAGLLDPFVVSCEAGWEKPDGRIFAEAAKAAGLAPAQCVLMGDSFVEDVSGAMAAGWGAVWYNPHQKPQPGEVTQAGAFEEVARIEELPELLLRLS